jgi:hypothetical protein
MAFEANGAVIYFSGTTAVSTADNRAIGEVTDFSVLTGNAAAIDITALGDNSKQKLVGVADEGQLTIGVNWNKSDAIQTDLYTARNARSKRKVCIKLNDTTSDAAKTKITFDAYVTGFSLTGSVDNKLAGNVTFEITGLASMSSVA